MANEKAGNTVNRESLNVRRKRLERIQELIRIFSGSRFTFNGSRLTEVL